MSEVQTVSIAIASAGVFAASIYYIFQIRHQTKLRQTDIVMRLYSIYSSKEFSEASIRYMTADFKNYNEFVEKYGSIPSENPVQIAYLTVATFFEGIGELLHKRLFDIEIVEDLFAVQLHWKKVEPLIMDLRKQFGPKYNQWFEYLHNELKKKEQKLQSTS